MFIPPIPAPCLFSFHRGQANAIIPSLTPFVFLSLFLTTGGEMEAGEPGEGGEMHELLLLPPPPMAVREGDLGQMALGLLRLTAHQRSMQEMLQVRMDFCMGSGQAHAQCYARLGQLVALASTFQVHGGQQWAKHLVTVFGAQEDVAWGAAVNCMRAQEQSARVRCSAMTPIRVRENNTFGLLGHSCLSSIYTHTLICVVPTAPLCRTCHTSLCKKRWPGCRSLWADMDTMYASGTTYARYECGAIWTYRQGRYADAGALLAFMATWGEVMHMG